MSDFNSGSDNMISNINQLVDEIKKREHWIESIQKEFNNAQMYLGEEKIRRQKIERELEDKNNLCQRLSEDLKNLQYHYNQSQWFLGESRSLNQHLEQALSCAEQRCQELNIKIEYLKKELADAQWFLGEERAKNKSSE
ncbi:MAG: hypothetical protein MUF05_06715 [Candidatus Omnitrophica bacterium]|jgi:chromosome segregation ATPase|nr:hypothetical protein [Candidatus Omnitrophota bacterium]